jgi:hypothetical protein
MRILRYSHLVLALVVCVTALGCGSGGGGSSSLDQGGQDQSAQRSSGTPESPGAPGSPGSPGAPGAPGARGNRGNQPQAIGAPIKIPSFQQDEGRPLDEVKAEIVQDLKRQCGGELCVTLRDEARDDSVNTLCQFVKTDPPQGTIVRAPTTIVIVSGALPCPTSTSSGAEEPTSTTDSTQESQSQSTDTTTGSTENSQPETPSST